MIEPEWLLELYPERVEEVDRRAFDTRTDRVERTTGLRYGALMLDETVAPAPLDEETSRLLADAVLARGLERLPGGDALPPLLQRLAFARRQAPEAFPSPDDGDVAGLVRAACAGHGSFAALGDPAALVLSALPPAAQRALHTTAPERVTLASGRSVPIHYDARRHALDRIAPAGLLRNARGAGLGRGACRADRASAGPQRARGPGDARSRRLLDAALPGAAASTEPPLSKTPLARRRRDRKAAAAPTAAPPEE